MLIPTTIIGVSWVITKAGVRISLVKLHQKGKHIQAIELVPDIDDFKALAGYIKTDLPVVLHVETHTGLHKKVNANDVPEVVIPGLKSDLFYIQESYCEESRYFSFIRREVIDEVIELLSTIKVFPIAVYTGPFAFQSISHQCAESFLVWPYQFKGHHNRCDFLIDFDIKHTESDSVLVGEVKIPTSLLLNYAGVIQYLSGSLSVLPVKQVSEYNLNRRFKLRYKTSLIAILIVFLIVLIGDFGLRTYFESHTNQVVEEGVYFQNQLLLKDSLTQKLNSTQGIVNSIGYNANPVIAYRCDRIAFLMPASITLSQLKYITSYKEVANESERNKIMVSGYCIREFELNNWIVSLKKEFWVDSVTIITMKYVPSANHTLFVFETKIRE